MAQTNNALPLLKPKEDKHHIFNDGKERTIRYVEWKDEMKTKARSCATRPKQFKRQRCICAYADADLAGCNNTNGYDA